LVLSRGAPAFFFLPLYSALPVSVPVRVGACQRRLFFFFFLTFHFFPVPLPPFTFHFGPSLLVSSRFLWCAGLGRTLPPPFLFSTGTLFPCIYPFFQSLFPLPLTFLCNYRTWPVDLPLRTIPPFDGLQPVALLFSGRVSLSGPLEFSFRSFGRLGDWLRWPVSTFCSFFPHPGRGHSLVPLWLKLRV